MVNNPNVSDGSYQATDDFVTLEPLCEFPSCESARHAAGYVLVHSTGDNPIADVTNSIESPFHALLIHCDIVARAKMPHGVPEEPFVVLLPSFCSSFPIEFAGVRSHIYQDCMNLPPSRPHATSRGQVR